VRRLFSLPTTRSTRKSIPLNQIAELMGLPDIGDIKLIGADKETEYKEMAVPSDFPLVDDGLVHVVVGGEAI